MWEAFSILFAAAIVNNFVLVQFLGLCPLVGTSQRMETAVPMSLATVFVIAVSMVVTHVIYNGVLLPLELEYLRIVVFIFTIAAVVQLCEIYVKHTSPLLHQLLGIYLPLITSNCAVLGVALTALDLPFTQSVFLAIGAALGFSLVLILFASQRQKIEQSATPRALRGTPIALITAGFMALAFTGFRGLI